MKLYNSPHPDRRKENEFCEFMVAYFDAEWVRNNFALDSSVVSRNLSTNWLIDRFKADTRLSSKKRGQCIECLESLPPVLRVIDSSKDISFDIVIEQRGAFYYWEFHEVQHRSFSVSRSSSVYGIDGVQYSIPRFLQRAIRDVWRARFFSDFTVVWFDWFAVNRAQFAPTLATGFRELAIPGMFNLRDFIWDV